LSRQDFCTISTIAKPDSFPKANLKKEDTQIVLETRNVSIGHR